MSEFPDNLSSAFGAEPGYRLRARVLVEGGKVSAGLADRYLVTVNTPSSCATVPRVRLSGKHLGMQGGCGDRRAVSLAPPRRQKPCFPRSRRASLLLR